MNLSIWDYLRRRACESFLAGCQDALEYLERHDHSQQIHTVAAALRRRFHENSENGKADVVTKENAIEKSLPQNQSRHSTTNHNSPAPPPQLAGPPSNQESGRRRPGRPRKEVHG